MVQDEVWQRDAEQQGLGYHPENLQHARTSFHAQVSSFLIQLRHET